MSASLGQMSRSALLQDVVDRLAAGHRGDPPAVVRRVLEAELLRAGVPVGAGTWLRHAAEEISAGRQLVVDGRRHHRPHGPVTTPAPRPAPRAAPPVTPALDARRRAGSPVRPRRASHPVPAWTTWVGAVLGAAVTVVVLRRRGPH